MSSGLAIGLTTRPIAATETLVGPCAVQPSGNSDANRVQAVARGFFRAQAISKQRGEQLVGLRGREWRCVVGGEKGNRLVCTRLNRGRRRRQGQ
eukprot:1032798-Pleurochrysis_carterae.AAC.7